MKPISLDGASLTVDDLTMLARSRNTITLTPEARQRVQASRALVEKWIRNDEVVYGVTTGFGEFSNVRIAPKDIDKLQENLITSHAAGAGDYLPKQISRAMMILRINALAKGCSGIRLEMLEQIVQMFNKGIIPVIPSQGSVGSSGDLVQLSHLVLALIGKGKVWGTGGVIVPAAQALKRNGLKPLKLAAKEGLALINGTQMMTAFAGLAISDSLRLVTLADIIGAMSVEALRGSDTPFDDRIHAVRPYDGQKTVARNIRRLMKGSEIRESHRHDDPRVQDAYSVRCIPQVHGASRDAIDYVHKIVSIELNSANDNPLIFADDGVHLEGGNFHGQPIALVMDFLAIALSELANISERRIERLVNGSLSGLPRFLTRKGGLNSGLMIAQYTAASIVSENKVLSHPASVDSIPTSANQEDHNSMGSISAQKAWRVLRNVQTVLAIELLCAAQALDFTRSGNGKNIMKAGQGVEAAHRFVRKHIRHLDEDRVLYDDIQSALEIVVDGEIRGAVEKSMDPLE